MTPEEKAQEWVDDWEEWLLDDDDRLYAVPSESVIAELTRLHAEIARLEAERDDANRSARLAHERVNGSVYALDKVRAQRDAALEFAKKCEAGALDAPRGLFTREQVGEACANYFNPLCQDDIDAIERAIDKVKR